MVKVTYFHLTIALFLSLIAIALYFIINYLDKPYVVCPIIRENNRKKRLIGYILLAVAAVVFVLALVFRKDLSGTFYKRQRGRQEGGLSKFQKLDAGIGKNDPYQVPAEYDLEEGADCNVYWNDKTTKQHVKTFTNAVRGCGGD